MANKDVEHARFDNALGPHTGREWERAEDFVLSLAVDEVGEDFVVITDKFGHILHRHTIQDVENRWATIAPRRSAPTLTAE
mmetsp:Transcript_12582/g.24408  ORF Transcript_12582/g.24408 Transcript_12582/m.24408 type:complete len:81 (-) Transcript_12582:1040-1282(-)